MSKSRRREVKKEGNTGRTHFLSNGQCKHSSVRHAEKNRGTGGGVRQ